MPPHDCRPVKIKFGEMPAGRNGVRDVIIYCADYRCSYSVAMSADQMG